MKMRIRKQWIAILCAVLLLPWNMLPSKANTTVTAPEDLEAWNIETVGLSKKVECNSSTSQIDGTATDASLDGKAFYATVKFAEKAADLTGSEYLRLNLGADRRNAFLLDAIADGSLRFAYFGKWDAVEVITPESVGCDTLVGTELDLVITTEFVNNNGTTTDVNVGIWINGTLYKDSYVKIKDLAVDTLQQNFFMDNAGKPTAGLSVSSASAVTSPDKLESWTIQSVKLDEITCNPSSGHWFTGVETGASLDGKAFRATVKFAEDPDNLTGDQYTRIVLGAGTSDKGLVIDAVSGGNLKFFYHDGKNNLKSITNITPAEAGCTLVGEKVDLIVTTEFVNKKDTTTDVKVGLYFGGKLYGGKYIRVNDVEIAGLVQNLSGNVWGDYGPDCETLWIGLPKKDSEAGKMTPIASLTSWNLTTVGLAEEIECDAEKHWFTGTATKETLDGKAFTTKIKFAEASSHITGEAYTRLVLGSGIGDTGLVIDAVEGGNLLFFYFDGSSRKFLTTIAPADVNYTDLVGTILELTVTTEFVNNNGTTTDVKVGIYVNGTAYKNQYIVVENAAVNLLTQNVSGNNWGKMDEKLWLGIKKEQTPPETVTPLEDLTCWTITDVGLKASECNEGVHWLTGTETGKDLNGKAFTSFVQYGNPDTKLAENGYLRLIIGSGETQGFILDAVAGGNLRFFYIDNGVEKNHTIITPEAAGCDLVGKQFKLSISTEFVNTGKDGSTTDVNVGLYFNDVLYKGSYIKVQNVSVATLNQNFRIDNWGAQNEILRVRNPFLTEYPDITDELTGADFGLKNSTISKKTAVGKYDDEALRDTAVTLNLKISNKKYNSIYFGGADCGIRLQSNEEGTLSLSYVEADGQEKHITNLDAKTAKVSSLLDTDLKWRFTFQICEKDSDGGELRLCIYVNGKWYASRAFTVENVKYSSMKRIIGVHAENGTIDIKETEYKVLTFRDFSIANTYVAEKKEGEEAYEKYNFYDLNSLDNTAVVGRVKFSKQEGDRFVIGGSSWQGFNVYNREDGRIGIAFVYGNGNVKNIIDLQTDKAGVDALVEAEIEIKLTFDVFETTDKTADVKIGVYINNKLYDGKYILATDLETAQLTRTCFVWTYKGPFMLESIEQKDVFSIYGFDADWKKTLGI